MFLHVTLEEQEVRHLWFALVLRCKLYKFVPASMKADPTGRAVITSATPQSY